MISAFFFLNKECALDRVRDIVDKSPIVFIKRVCIQFVCVEYEVRVAVNMNN